MMGKIFRKRPAIWALDSECLVLISRPANYCGPGVLGQPYFALACSASPLAPVWPPLNQSSCISLVFIEWSSPGIASIHPLLPKHSSETWIWTVDIGEAARSFFLASGAGGSRSKILLSRLCCYWPLWQTYVRILLLVKLLWGKFQVCAVVEQTQHGVASCLKILFYGSFWPPKADRVMSNLIPKR
ncbi:hypothetical protein BC567DRAFT_8026 [Phyllosticta citribraziliensis]